MVGSTDSRTGGPFRDLSFPRLYNLLLDPKEEHPAAPNVPENFRVRFPASKVLADHAASLKKEPSIRPGTPDPYNPEGTGMKISDKLTTQDMRG